MPVLGCGAEMSRLMEVADQDVAAIEDVIQERLDMGVSQVVAQRQAVDEVLAQLGEERSMVMKAIQEQLGFTPGAVNEPVFSNKSHTDTPEFKRWFGDSKVVDADGKPLVVYHGAKWDIEDGVFRMEKGMLGTGAYFTSDPQEADFYTSNAAWRTDANIVPAFVSIKNPYYAKDKWDKGALTAKANGHDGVILRKADGSVEWAIPFSPTQIKSAIGNNGQFDPENPDIRFSNKPYYSALARAIDALPAKALPAGAWANEVNGMVKNGKAKAEEVEWTGLNDWLALQEGKVTKEAVMSYLDNNGVRVEETSLESDSTKYGQYTLPGGEKYRELLLTLPPKTKAAPSSLATSDGRTVLLGAQTRREIDQDQGIYRSSHWDQPNILAHIRVNDRTDADGKRVLFVEEVQSDWGQDGKKKGFKQPFVISAPKYTGEQITVRQLLEREGAKGQDWLDGQNAMRADLGDPPLTDDSQIQVIYKDGKMDRATARIRGPVSGLVQMVRQGAERLNAAQAADHARQNIDRLTPAPFVTKTEGWLNLALKRVIKMAVDEGYDRVAFVNGEQSAERYDLSKQVEELMIEKAGDDFVIAMKPVGQGYGAGGRWSGKAQELPDVVGKELADKVAAQPEGRSYMRGLDLKVGGEGMKTFYDKIVPNAVRDLLKKLKTGAEMGTVKLPLESEYLLHADNGQEITFKSEEEANYWLIENSETGWGELVPVGGNPQPGFDVTDQMRAVAGEGLPLFANKAKGNKSEGRFIDRDAAGRWRFAIARQSADFLARMGGRKILDKLYLTMPSGPVREQLRQMKLDNQRGLDTATEIAEQVNLIPLAERELVSDVIEQEVKAGIIPPQHVIETAALMNDAIGKQTDKLVELGMLSQEAADRWRGKYLPRYYEPRLKDTVAQTWADVVGKFRNYPAAEMGIKGRSLKGRGTYLTIPTSDLAKFEALGWEIRDKSYDKATSQEVRVWRDYTREEREKMGEIRDAGFRFVLGYMQTQRDIALGTMYKRLAADPDFSSANEKEGWVRVPDTKVPDTDAYRYGKLAGRYVPADLMMQLQTEREMESEALRTYKKALSWWKSNKTVMNPVGHMNNFVSNITMAHFGGVSYWDAQKYVGAIKDFTTGAQSIKDARDAGLFLGDMTDTDLHRLLPPELKALLDKIDPATMKALRFADTLLTFGLRGKMTQAYEFGDKFFKYMLWKDAKDRGATDSEAVEHAQKYIFNYDDLPLGARRIRDFGLPFFSYTYKAIPALVDTAASRPDRFFLPAGLIVLANAMAYAVAAAGDDDDWLKAAKRYLTDPEYRKKAKEMEEDERKKLPEWMKGFTSLGTEKNIRMGTDKLTDLPVFLDISRFIPGGDLLDMDSNVSGAFPLFQVLTPNNPLLSIYSGMVLNKDAYFGKDIVNPKTDDSGESTAKRADFLWKLATPAIAVGGTMWDKAINLAAHYNGGELPIPDAVGGSLTGVGKDGVPIQPKYGIPSLVGIKARPMDLEMSESIDKSNRRKTLAELDAQLRQARRMNSKGAMSDRVYDRTVEKIQTKKERIREGLTIDGNEKD